MLKTVVITFLLTFTLFIGGTTSADGQDLNWEILQGKWALTAVDGVRISGRQPVYFEVRGDTISGFDGCNMFGGNLNDLQRMRATLRGCADHVAYLDMGNLQSQLSSAIVEGSLLKVTAYDGTTVLEFKHE